MEQSNKIQNYTDEDLYRLVKLKEDKAAFSSLFERYKHLVLGVGLNHNSLEKAKEGVNTIFEKIWTQKEEMPLSMRFREWLYRLSLNFFSKIGNKVSDDKPVFEGEEWLTLDQLEINELGAERVEQRIEQYLQDKKGLMTTCLELFYKEGKNFVTIAQLMGLSVEEVMKMIVKGKKDLKDCIER